MTRTCYVVLRLDPNAAGELVAAHVGYYSENALSLTSIVSGALNVDVFSITDSSFDRAYETAIKQVDALAGMGMPQWVKVEELSR